MSVLIWTICPLAGVVVGSYISKGTHRSHQLHGGRAVPNLGTVQAITALTFLLVFLRTGWAWRLAPLLLLASTLIAVSIIDWCQQRIPNIVIKPAFAASLVFLFVLSAIGEPGSPSLALFGAVSFSGLLGVVHLISPSGMGMGDVRLAALLGLFVGWLSQDWLHTGWRLGFVLLLASTLGLLGAAVMYSRHKGPATNRSLQEIRQYRVPFGPALSLATGLVILGFA